MEKYINKSDITSIEIIPQKICKWYSYIDEEEIKFLGIVFRNKVKGFSAGNLMPFFDNEKDFLINQKNSIVINKKVYELPNIKIELCNRSIIYKYFNDKNELLKYFDENFKQLNLLKII